MLWKTPSEKNSHLLEHSVIITFYFPSFSLYADLCWVEELDTLEFNGEKYCSLIQ